MSPLLPPLSLPHLSTLHRNQVEREERRALGQAGINIQDRVFTSEEVREGRGGKVAVRKGGSEGSARLHLWGEGGGKGLLCRISCCASTPTWIVAFPKDFQYSIFAPP